MGAPGWLMRSAAAMATALAFGWASAPVDAWAQGARKATPASQSKTAKTHAPQRSNQVKPRRVEARAKKSASSRKAPLRKKRSVVRTAVTKKPLATSAKGKRAAVVARRQPLAPAPREWPLPPLGPERFYPNGIPELHPAFLHPLPGAPVVTGQAAAAREPGAEPEWLP